MSVVKGNTSRRGVLGAINGAHHRAILGLYMVIVLAHWAEHLVQAYQIWALGWARPQARGVLGMPFPWLVSSEWLHYGYAIVMLIGLFALRPGFVGRARTWWTVALVIQFWHHIEHLLLLLQVQLGFLLPGATAPTSLVQLVVPRVELHLFYNSIVFIPMLVAMYLHLRPNDSELWQMQCSCAPTAQRRMTLAPTAG
ncbi:hypothetical protein F8271_01780 [Micromonospora sp. ALFpr18c]|uniref:hypothetical protein n=1 Tax=unclassified Micromonospora TaxID=2617518 RepID=UPI00124BB0AE|nr:hypothetical protein [Micromonospora sp. ALFpr18c]KAB1948725.1 hypothetical protein F8271_01780 [Micromonospora sp. ALFpr18c]